MPRKLPGVPDILPARCATVSGDMAQVRTVVWTQVESEETGPGVSPECSQVSEENEAESWQEGQPEGPEEAHQAKM